jgi:hypothetical protein
VALRVLAAMFVLTATVLATGAGTARAQPRPAPSPADTDGNGEPDETFAIRGGLNVGFGAIERGDYVLFDVTALVRVWNVRADLWVPLRFYTADFGFVSEDWDDARDFTRIGRCVRLDLGDYQHPADEYDPTCDPYGWGPNGIHDRIYFSLRLEPLQGVTLGHGSLMFQYRSSRDLERPQLGVHSNFLLRDWGSAELVLDDITNPAVMAGRIEVRPIQLITGDDWDRTPDDFVVAATFAADVQAPLYRQTAFGRPLLDQYGNARFTRDALAAFSADVHYIYFWGLSGEEQAEGAPEMGLMAFADWVSFPEVQDSHALHAGARFLFKDDGWELAIGAEYRLTGNRYLPEYFDTEYVSRAQQFLLTPELRTLPGLDPYITKYEYMLSLPGGTRHGGQIYGQLTIPVPVNAGGGISPLPVGLFFEEAEGPANASVAFWIGPFQMDQLIVAAQYMRRNFDDLVQMFELDGTLIRLLGRFYLGSSHAEPGSVDEILQNVHLDLRFDRRFFQTRQGDLAETNDFAITVGFTAGT